MKTNITILTAALAMLFVQSQGFAAQTDQKKSTTDTQQRSIYVGAGLGYSALDTSDDNVFSLNADTSSFNYTEPNSTSETGGLGGNLFVGYNINKNFAVEADYVKYAESEYKSTQNQYNATTSALIGSNTAKLDYKTQSYGLFLKGTLPIQSKLSVFAKVGAAYVSQENDYSNPTGTPTISVNNNKIATPKDGDHTYTAVRPAGGIGLSYQFTKNVGASLFAEGFLGEGDMDSDQDAIADAYLAGVSMTYTFG